MFGMLPNILPENRIFTDEYLAGTWKALYEVTAAVEYRIVPDGLETRFVSYVEAEEKRLQANLNDIRYDIDELDALTLVTGPGRIEKVSANAPIIFSCYLFTVVPQHFFPLVRLMLEHHMKVFRIAKTRVLNIMELIDAGESFEYVMKAVTYRYNDLKSASTGLSSLVVY